MENSISLRDSDRTIDHKCPDLVPTGYVSWIGRKLTRYKYVRNALATRADLSRFRRRPSRRTAVGLILAGGGLVLGWPGASLALVLAAVLGEPILALYVAPGLYLFSWIPYLVGIGIGGPASLDYLRDFNRWLTRKVVEWLGGKIPASDGQAPTTDPPTGG